MNATADDESSRIVLRPMGPRGESASAPRSAPPLRAPATPAAALPPTHKGRPRSCTDQIRALRPGEENPRHARAARPRGISPHSTASARPCFIAAGAGSTPSSATPASSRPVSPPHHIDPKDWDDVIAVNVTANWRPRSAPARPAAAPRAPAGRAASDHLGGRPAARICAPYRAAYAMLQGRARRHRAHPRRRNAEHPPTSGLCSLSWPAVHANARQGLTAGGRIRCRCARRRTSRPKYIAAHLACRNGRNCKKPTIFRAIRAVIPGRRIGSTTRSALAVGTGRRAEFGSGPGASTAHEGRRGVPLPYPRWRGGVICRKWPCGRRNPPV